MDRRTRRSGEMLEFKLWLRSRNMYYGTLVIPKRVGLLLPWRECLEQQRGKGVEGGGSAALYTRCILPDATPVPFRPAGSRGARCEVDDGRKPQSGPGFTRKSLCAKAAPQSVPQFSTTSESRFSDPCVGAMRG